MRTIRERCASGVKILAMKSIFSPPSARGVTGTPRPANIAGRAINWALIELSNVYGKPPEHIRRPFRRAGRSELYATGSGQGRSSSLSSDQVAPISLSRRAGSRQTSDALRQGRVVLRQGRWNAAAHTVLTCEGQTVTPDLDSRALAHIERRQSHASAAVSIAWLEAPEGSQLLLVANENFCTWQADGKSF